MKDLKEKTIRSGSARVAALATNFLVRVGSLASRLLDPKDFGLLGMVTAFTGVLSLFRDFGLSAAAIQKAEITEEQSSTLFWINILVGASLTAIAMLLAPVVALLYHEPRLFWITSVVAIGFVITTRAHRQSPPTTAVTPAHQLATGHPFAIDFVGPA